MAIYLIVFLAAMAFSFGATPLARYLAVRTGTVDLPSMRKLHVQAMPLLGGLAIYIAAVSALLVFGDRFYVPQLIGILIGASFVSFLGVWDDRRGLAPVLKLLGQIIAAVVLVVSGVYVEFLRNDILGYLATVLWVVAITNGVNLLDNMDGLAGGVGVIASAFFALLASLSGQYFVGSLAIAMAGACLGFLRYNFNPARVFMGDAGTMFIGFTLAAIAIKLRFENMDIVTWMIPVLVLGLPIFDTTLVVLSRLRRRLNPFTTPGKDHTSHRLVIMGLTQREAVMVLYLACGVLGMCAVFLTRASLSEGYILGAIVLLAAIAALVRLARVPVQAERPDGGGK